MTREWGRMTGGASQRMSEESDGQYNIRKGTRIVRVHVKDRNMRTTVGGAIQQPGKVEKQLERKGHKPGGACERVFEKNTGELIKLQGKLSEYPYIQGRVAKHK
jgi:hypothetical protein